MTKVPILKKTSAMEIEALFRLLVLAGEIFGNFVILSLVGYSSFDISHFLFRFHWKRRNLFPFSTTCRPR